MWAAFGPPTCRISPRTAFPALDCDVESPPLEESKSAGSEMLSQPTSTAEARLASSSFPSDRPRLSYAFRRGGTMTIPTDPYNSPQRRPFSSLSTKRSPKRRISGIRRQKSPTRRDEPTRARGRARMNDPRQAKHPAREEDPAAAPHLGTAARRRRASCSPGRRRCRPNPT